MAVIGSLRLVASLQLLVSFAEYSLVYRALLHKRPIISRSLYMQIKHWWLMIMNIIWEGYATISLRDDYGWHSWQVRGVSFAEYSLFYRALLQQRPIISEMIGSIHYNRDTNTKKDRQPQSKREERVAIHYRPHRGVAKIIGLFCKRAL